MIREPALLHVACASMKDEGDEHAMCTSGPFIVMTAKFGRLAVYDAWSLAFLSFVEWGDYAGMCAGTTANPTILICNVSTRRIDELSLPSGEFVRQLGVGPLREPTCVAANTVHIAVSERASNTSRVLLFSIDAAYDVAPLWAFDGAPGLSLRHALGLRLSRDGTAVFVADYGNSRVLRIPLHCAHDDVAVIASSENVSQPRDVLELDDGTVLIADWTLGKVERDGGVRFASDVNVYFPSALATCAVSNRVLVRARNQLDVLRKNPWSGARLAWITALAAQH